MATFHSQEVAYCGVEGNMAELTAPEVNPGLGGHRHTTTYGLLLGTAGFS